MGMVLRRYPPVAAELSRREISAARRAVETSDQCLQKVADYLGARYLFPVSSGRAGLYAILKSSLAPGSKVVLPGYTCYTVAAAVVRAGMTPILSDNDPADLGYDLENLRRTLAEQQDVKAIVVCHLFGIALNIDDIKKIAGSEIMVVDDAAQAFGVRVQGRLLGTAGHCGFYSFGRGKNLSLVGGGLIATNNDYIGERIGTLIGSEFMPAQSSWKEVMLALSYNQATHPVLYNLLSRLPGLHLGRSEFNPDFALSELSDFKVKLLAQTWQKGESLNHRRLEISRQYAGRLDGNVRVFIPRSAMNNEPGTLRFPLLAKDTNRRQTIQHSPAAKYLGLSGMYPTALNALPALPELARFTLPGAEQIARSLITLPTHRYIAADNDRFRLIDKIVELFG